MCPHLSTVEDVATGTLVCTDCGLVLDNLVFGMSVREDNHRAVSHTSMETILLEEIRNLLARLCIESDCVADDIMDFIRTHYSSKSPLHLTTNTRLALVAFATWEVLNRRECAFDPHFIAEKGGVEPSDLLKWEKNLNTAPTFCNPSLYVSRLISALGLPRSIAVLVLKTVQRMDNIFFLKQPEVICAGVLFHLLEIMAHQRGRRFPQVNKKHICHTFGISSSSVNQFCKTIPPEILQVIALRENQLNYSRLRTVEL